MAPNVRRTSDGRHRREVREYPADYFADLEERERLQAEIVRRVQGGAVSEEAARAVGVDRGTLLRWLDESVEFESALLEATEDEQERQLRELREELERRRARERARTAKANAARQAKAHKRQEHILDAARAAEQSGQKRESIANSEEWSRSTFFRTLSKRGLTRTK